MHPQLVQAWTSRLLEADCRNTSGAVKVVDEAEATKFMFITIFSLIFLAFPEVLDLAHLSISVIIALKASIN